MSSSMKLKLKPEAFKNAISNQNITFECLNCDTEITITASLIGSATKCPNCKSTINLTDDGFSDSLNKLQKDFENMFK